MALKALSEEYCALEREWWDWRRKFLEGPLTRGFELWRSHPQWYMHPVLREDCAKRGGCCGRDCGCCVRRLVSVCRNLEAGHCSIECCRKFRGFDLSLQQKAKYKRQFAGRDGEGSRQNQYYYRIYLASIWGLWSSSNESPFTLVDKELRLLREQPGARGLDVISLEEGVDKGASESIPLM